MSHVTSILLVLILIITGSIIASISSMSLVNATASPNSDKAYIINPNLNEGIVKPISLNSSESISSGSSSNETNSTSTNITTTPTSARSET